MCVLNCILFPYAETAEHLRSSGQGSCKRHTARHSEGQKRITAVLGGNQVLGGCRLESTGRREDSNAEVVQQLRQGAEARLQAMETAVSSTLLQQQELYSAIQQITSQFMQQKGVDLTTLQVCMALSC